MVASKSNGSANFSSQVYQEMQRKWDEVHDQFIVLSKFEKDSEEFYKELNKLDDLLATVKDHKKIESAAASSVLFNLVKVECEDSEVVEKLCRLSQKYLIEICFKQKLNDLVEKEEKLNRAELESLATLVASTVDYVRGIFIHRLFALLLLLTEEGLGFASGNPMTIAAIKNKTAELWQWASYSELKFRSGVGRGIKWNPSNLTFGIVEAMAAINNPRTINYSTVARKINEKNGTKLTDGSLAQLVKRNHIDWKELKKLDKTRLKSVKKI